MKRYLYNNLLQWKNDPKRKPLILQGARQVGKTYLVNQFAENEYNNYIYLNFEKNTDLSLIFEGNIDPKKIINQLSFYYGKKIDPLTSLLFFDEIQTSQRALTSLKYFYEETPEYHIIAAGSLLGVTVGKSSSFPVGKVNFMKMYPMNFSEYLIASDEMMLAELLKEKTNCEPLAEIIHEKLISYLKQYLFLGGMPEVIADFIKHRDVKTVRQIQKDILQAYKRDFSKYTNRNQSLKNLELWHSIPYQLAKENKKFKYSDIKKQARASLYDSSIEWLKQAGLVLIANNLSTAKLPLSGHLDNSKFKLYLFDTGLLGAMLNISSEIIIQPDKLFKEYNGAFIENFVATETQAIFDDNLCYWTSSGLAEVDFIFQNEHEIYPLEVKSGTSKTLKSLRVYYEKYKPKIIFRTSPRNFYKRDEFINIPLYAISSIKNQID